jgi:hypothetical protein
MTSANMIIPSALVSQIVKGFDLTPSKRGYVAPTVFKVSGPTIGGYNYYKTVKDAFEKLRWMCNVPGAKNVTPAGSVPLSNPAATTVGINVDFYVGLSVNDYSPAHYLFARAAMQNLGSKFYFVFRFYKTDGSGPYYAIFDPTIFGMSATALDNVNTKNLAELDEFYRSVSLLKHQHNTMVEFVNEQVKLPFSPARQMTINEGQMSISNMRAQISSIKGLEVQYMSGGGIGVIMLAPLVWWAIAAVVATWSITAIVTEVQKTKRITASFDFQKWAAEHKLRLAQEAQAGNISQADAAALSQQADQASKNAGNVAANTAASNSMFGDIASIAKWGIVAVIGIKVLNTFSSSKS